MKGCSDGGMKGGKDGGMKGGKDVGMKGGKDGAMEGRGAGDLEKGLSEMEMNVECDRGSKTLPGPSLSRRRPPSPSAEGADGWTEVLRDGRMNGQMD